MSTFIPCLPVLLPLVTIAEYSSSLAILSKFWCKSIVHPISSPSSFAAGKYWAWLLLHIKGPRSRWSFASPESQSIPSFDYPCTISILLSQFFSKTTLQIWIWIPLWAHRRNMHAKYLWDRYQCALTTTPNLVNRCFGTGTRSTLVSRNYASIPLGITKFSQASSHLHGISGPMACSLAPVLALFVLSWAWNFFVVFNDCMKHIHIPSSRKSRRKPMTRNNRPQSRSPAFEKLVRKVIKASRNQSLFCGPWSMSWTLVATKESPIVQDASLWHSKQLELFSIPCNLGSHTSSCWSPCITMDTWLYVSSSVLL